jgi:hypothetical protein
MEGAGSPTSQQMLNTPPPQGDFASSISEIIFSHDTIVSFAGSCHCQNDTFHSEISRTCYPFTVTDTMLTLMVGDSATASCTTKVMAQFGRLSGKNVFGNWIYDTATFRTSGAAKTGDSSYAKQVCKGVVAIAIKWMRIDSASSTMILYTNPDTTLFVTQFLAQYSSYLSVNHLGADSVGPNCLKVIGVNANANTSGLTKSPFDTLTITNCYRGHTTTYLTSDASDTARYKPDPYVFDGATMCPTKSQPQWINQFVSDHQPF